MKALNKLIKLVGYAGIYGYTLFQCYVLSLIATGSCLSAILAVHSAVKRVPSLLAEKFYLVYVVASLPVALLFFIMVLTGFTGRTRRK